MRPLYNIWEPAWKVKGWRGGGLLCISPTETAWAQWDWSSPCGSPEEGGVGLKRSLGAPPSEGFWSSLSSPDSCVDFCMQALPFTWSLAPWGSLLLPLLAVTGLVSIRDMKGGLETSSLLTAPTLMSRWFRCSVSCCSIPPQVTLSLQESPETGLRSFFLTFSWLKKFKLCKSNSNPPQYFKSIIQKARQWKSRLQRYDFNFSLALFAKALFSARSLVWKLDGGPLSGPPGRRVQGPGLWWGYWHLVVKKVIKCPHSWAKDPWAIPLPLTPVRRPPPSGGRHSFYLLTPQWTLKSADYVLPGQTPSEWASQAHSSSEIHLLGPHLC